MKFFVTGVGGQLGHDVMNELLKRGHESIGSDIQENYSGVADGSAVTKAPYVALDITDKDAVEKVITEINPDAVIHCAAWTAVDMAEDDDKVAKVRAINAGGTQNIADVCTKLGCKMTYISTDYVFDGQGTEPWQPDCKDYKPLNVYGQTKLEGELAVSQTLEKYFIVRIAWVFGLNGKNFIKTMLNVGKTHDTVRVVNDQIGTPTYVTVITAVETFEITNSLNTPRIVYFIQGHENWGVSEDHLHYTYRSEMPKITIAKWLSDIVDQYSPVKSICIPDGIDSTIFYRTEQKKDKHSIVFHYRKAAYKGCDVALEVLDRLKQKYSDLKVYVVSNESIEDLPNWMIKRSQITPQEVAAINNNCEVFLCTSREEGYGLPGLEGMACGCALVSTSYAGVLEYAVDGLNSLLAPVDDVEKLENNIIIIFEDRELREKIVVQGMRTAEELSVDNAARKFEEVLKSRGDNE